MGNVVAIKGAQSPPRAQQSRMDTIIMTQEMANNWKIPPFQRPLRVNAKVQSVTEEIKKTETIEGVLTLGSVKSETSLYIVDGQHRIEAFKLSALPEVIADVRVIAFSDMSEMSTEFVRLNSSLVKMRPDDILRGLESSTPALLTIRKSCAFVGYDNIRRNTRSPLLSMSALLRCWFASRYETPSPTSGGLSAAQMASAIDQPSLQNMLAFLSTAHAAWGRDPEYYRLWGNLNLALCMWLWNKLVIDRERFGNKRYTVLTIPDFKRCLMSVSAENDYLSWLPGRNLTDRDRSPCYLRLKAIFARRLTADTKIRPSLPSPAWASK